jgi:hypothetical protein
MKQKLDWDKVKYQTEIYRYCSMVGHQTISPISSCYCRCGHKKWEPWEAPIVDHFIEIDPCESGQYISQDYGGYARY